jgi:hypothetical protein
MGSSDVKAPRFISRPELIGITHSMPCTEVSYSQGEQQDRMGKLAIAKAISDPPIRAKHCREKTEQGEKAPAKGREGDCSRKWQNQFRFA